MRRFAQYPDRKPTSCPQRCMIALIALIATALPAQFVLAQHARESAPVVVTIPDTLSSLDIMREIRGLRDNTTMPRTARFKNILVYVEALETRFPNFKDINEATLLKLSALSGLATTNAHYAAKFLTATTDLNEKNPTGKFASEVAYYSVQAFVHAARAEGMAERRILLGAEERYRAFVADHKDSKRRPVMLASLIRNLCRQDKIDQAELSLKTLQTEYPKATATVRATAEVRVRKIINTAVTIDFKPKRGPEIKSADHKGKVILIHMWSSFSQAGVRSLNPVAKAYRDYGPERIYIHSLNLDTDTTQAEIIIEQKNLPWAQSFDDRGYLCELAESFAVRRIPAFIMIDSNGILRYLGRGEAVSEAISTAMAKVKKPEAKVKNPKTEVKKPLVD